MDSRNTGYTRILSWSSSNGYVFFCSKQLYHLNLQHKAKTQAINYKSFQHVSSKFVNKTDQLESSWLSFFGFPDHLFQNVFGHMLSAARSTRELPNGRQLHVVFVFRRFRGERYPPGKETDISPRGKILNSCHFFKKTCNYKCKSM